jgi:hypothetical protein
MFSKTKIALSVALILGTASVALAGSSGYVVPGSRAGVNPVHHPRSAPNHAGADRGYAFAPSVTHNGAVAASRPWSGCDNMFTYDRALNGYSYDLVCNGINLSPH